MDRVENSTSNVDTRNVFQDVAYSTTSATDRGSKWGADDDHTMGRTYLDKIASEGGATIADLYNKGFGRTESEMAADTTGPTYWQNKLDSGEMTIQQIANAFAQSEEANIKDVYADEFNRDTDESGLQYWMNVSSATNSAPTNHGAFDASDLVRDSIRLRGEGEQIESSVRDHGWLTMGQASTRGQRGDYTAEEVAAGAVNLKPPDAPFTDMETEQVLDWVNQIRKGDMTLDEVKDILTDRSDRMSAFNEGDTDDYTTKDINGDGEITPDEVQTGSPTGMGRFASLQEIQATIDSGETPDQIRERLGMQKWGLLTHENQKKLEDFKRKSKDYDQYRSTWQGGFNTGDTGTGTGTGTGSFGQSGWTPEVLDKPSRPDPFPVDRKDIEYMPGETPDQFSSTPYGAAKKEFDAEAGILRPQVMPQPKAQDVGQRFTGTSAKGVRMKRSKASRMGTIRGTKQLGREQQTKSLNI